MVDFNQDSTMSKPPQDIVALIVLEKVYNYLEAEEDFTRLRLSGAASSLAVCRARLRTLFLICEAMLNRRLDEKPFKELKEVCLAKTSKEEEDTLKAFTEILTELDKLGLTKLDTKPYVNRQSIEGSNKAHGF